MLLTIEKNNMTLMTADSAQYVTFSDDEDTTTSSFADDASKWETFVIRFGKFKGQTLASMITRGRTRGYLRYILSWPDIRPNTHLNISAALAHYDKLKKEREARKMEEDEVVLPPPPKLSRSETNA